VPFSWKSKAIFAMQFRWLDMVQQPTRQIVGL